MTVEIMLHIKIIVMIVIILRFSGILLTILLFLVNEYILFLTLLSVFHCCLPCTVRPLSFAPILSAVFEAKT